MNKKKNSADGPRIVLPPSAAVLLLKKDANAVPIVANVQRTASRRLHPFEPQVNGLTVKRPSRLMVLGSAE